VDIVLNDRTHLGSFLVCWCIKPVPYKLTGFYFLARATPNGKLLKGVVSALTESPSKPEEVHFLKPVKLSRTDMKIALTSLDQAQLYVLFKLWLNSQMIELVSSTKWAEGTLAGAETSFLIGGGEHLWMWSERSDLCMSARSPALPAEPLSWWAGLLAGGKAAASPGEKVSMFQAAWSLNG